MRHRSKIKVKVYRRNPKRGRARKASKRLRRRHTHYGKVKAHRRRVNPARRVKRSHKRAFRMTRRKNPARSRSSRFSLSSIKSTLSIRNIVRFVAMGAGFLLGNQVSRFLSTGGFLFYTPDTQPSWTQTIAPARPFFGLAHILLGGILAAKLKNPKLKDAALGVAVAGGVDLVGQVVGYLQPASTAGLDFSPGMSSISTYGDDNPVPMAFDQMRSMGMDVSLGMDVPGLYQ